MRQGGKGVDELMVEARALLWNRSSVEGVAQKTRLNQSFDAF